MNRFANLVSSINPSFVKDITSNIFIDLGSFKTRVIVDGKLTYNEASLLIVHQESQSVLSIGDKALDLLNKTPSGTEVVFPLKNGVIADDVLTKAYLRALIEKLFPKKKVLHNLQGAVSVMTDSSSVEQQIQKKILNELGWGTLKIYPQADAVFSKLQKNLKVENLCILDIGFEKSELSLFSYKERVYVRAMELGGLNFTRAIKDIVRKKYQTEISFQTAEEVKLSIGRINNKSQAKDKDLKKIAVRGKDLLDNTIKTITISNDDFFAVYEQLADELLAEINIFFAKIPAQLLTLILEKGIYITGGGSKLAGLTDYLSKKLKCEFIQSKTAELDVVEGLSMMGNV